MYWYALSFRILVGELNVNSVEEQLAKLKHQVQMARVVAETVSDKFLS